MHHLHDNEGNVNRNTKEDKEWTQVTKGVKLQQSLALGIVL